MGWQSNSIVGWLVKRCPGLPGGRIKSKISIRSLSTYRAVRSVTPEFLDYLLAAIGRSSIPAHKLCFEVTETAAISNINEAVGFMTRLKEIGCQFALDDFGSGLSSFAYLKTLPVDILKIDGLFVRDIDSDPISRAMVKSINEIGQVMGMKTVAEFVASESILDCLMTMGVDYVQGYAIAEPCALDALLSRRWEPSPPPDPAVSRECTAN